MIRVLVAEDSQTVRELLVRILDADPDITVAGEAKDGAEAVEMAARLKPDLLTMDIQMPLLDGLAATKEVMIRSPLPILIISSGIEHDVKLALDAVRAGALSALAVPVHPSHPDFEAQRTNLLRTVKAMAQVKVVRRWGDRAPRAPRVASLPKGRVRLIAIAASTGGPAALQRILMDLPRDFPLPLLVVQHISSGFAEGLATWLAGSCNLQVTIARDGQNLQPRSVYVAPDDRHLGVADDESIELSDAPPIGGFRPSATHLFRTVALRFGREAAGVILSGMGRDGVDGLRDLHAAGGTVIAQDEASSIIFGMPQEAAREGVVDTVLPLREIGPALVSLTER